MAIQEKREEYEEEEPTTTYRIGIGAGAADALGSPPRQAQLLLACRPELLGRCSPTAVRLALLVCSSELIRREGSGIGSVFCIL